MAMDIRISEKLNAVPPELDSNKNIHSFVRFLFILLVKIYIELGMNDIVQQSQ